MIEIQRIQNEQVATPEMAAFLAQCIKDLQWQQTSIELDFDFVRRELFEWAYDSEKCFFVAKDEEKIIGMMMGKKQRYPFSPTEIVCEHYVRVDEKYRKNGIGEKLINSLADWGREQGKKILSIGINSYTGKDTSGAIIAFEKMGFKIFNYNYFKEI